MINQYSNYSSAKCTAMTVIAFTGDLYQSQSILFVIDPFRMI